MLGLPILYVLFTSGSTPVALNLEGAFVAAPSATNKLISPALVLPVPAPKAIPADKYLFRLRYKLCINPIG